MKLLLLSVLMAFLAIAQVFCEEIDPKEETDYWTSTSQIQVTATDVYLYSQLSPSKVPQITVA